MSTAIHKNTFFVNAMYQSTITSNRIKNGTLTDDEKLLTKQDYYFSYFFAVKECCIRATSGNDKAIKLQYLDWLRWNKVFVDHAFNLFYDDKELLSHYPELKQFALLILVLEEKTYNENLTITDNEKGAINEYQHTYDMAQTRNPKTLVLYLGKTFRSYIEMLIRRQCTVEFGCNKSLDDLTKEANFIIASVRRHDANLANGLTTDWDNFCSFVKGDENCRTIQDGLLGAALAEEHCFQQADNITKILIKFERLKEAILKRLKAKVDEVRNSSILVALQNPRQTLKSMLDWIIENPFKGTLFVIGSISLTLFTVFVPPAIYLFNTAVIGIATYHITAAYFSCAKIISEAESEIAKLNLECEKEIEGIKTDANKFCDDELRKEEKRKYMEAENKRLEEEKKRQYEAAIRRYDENCNRVAEEEQRADEVSNLQLALLSTDQLNIGLVEIVERLSETRQLQEQSDRERNNRLQKMAQREIDNIEFRQGREDFRNLLLRSLENTDDPTFEHPTLE